MKKQVFFAGIFSIALAFVLTMVGCDGLLDLLEEYTVIFDAGDGGYVNPVSVKVKPGDPVGVLPIPTKAGNTFDAWYTLKDGGGTKFTPTTIIDADITVYANWTPGAGSGKDGEGGKGDDTGRDPGKEGGNEDEAEGKDPGKEGGGTITFTGIDSQYYGQYATFRSSGSTAPSGGIYLVGTTDSAALTGVQITGGSVTIPVYLVENESISSAVPYTGSDQGIRIYLIIQNDSPVFLPAVFEGNGQYTINGVDFSNGSASANVMNGGAGGGGGIGGGNLPEVKGKLTLTGFDDFDDQYVFPILGTASGISIAGVNGVELTGAGPIVSMVKITNGRAEIPLYRYNGEPSAITMADIFPYEGSEAISFVEVMFVTNTDGWVRITESEVGDVTGNVTGIIRRNPANTTFTPSTSGGNIAIRRNDVMMGEGYPSMETAKYLFEFPRQGGGDIPGGFPGGSGDSNGGPALVY
jgi:uncharacterized repeat protein (TIGR02543 family)